MDWLRFKDAAGRGGATRGRSFFLHCVCTTAPSPAYARASYCSVAGRVQEVAGVATVVKSLPATDLLLDGTCSGVLPAAGMNANRGRPTPSAQAPSLERIPPLISPRSLPPQQRSASHPLLFPIIFRMATDATTKLPPVVTPVLNDGRRLADVVASLGLAHRGPRKLESLEWCIMDDRSSARGSRTSSNPCGRRRLCFRGW